VDYFKTMSSKEVGLGGIKCPCCGPKPGKDRDKLRRRARARIKAIDKNSQEQNSLKG
jgi:hypothetical protein